MDNLTLKSEPRTESGSRPARRMRRDGLVPAVVYGRELETTAVAVNARELHATLHTEAGLNALITLHVADKEVLTVAREVQRDPVRGDIIHLDFVNISLTETIEAEVGIEFDGTPVGVVDDGGVMDMVRNSVMVEALPTDIPQSIMLDVSALQIGDSLKISDLPVIDGVTYSEDHDETVVTVLAPRLIEEEPEEDLEGLELEEGEEPEEGDDDDDDSGDES